MAKADIDGTSFIEMLDEKHILPSLSPVVVALIELATSDESSLGQMADLIMKDPALTAQILKLANSAFFRSQCPASTPLQAITRIGAHHTRLFALSVSLKDAFPLKREGSLDYGRFWRLCLYQGLISRSLAQTLKVGDPEEAFTAGLTLEIGLLVLVRACVDDATVYLDYPLPSLLAKEKELYGVQHRQIGEALLRTWRFPESIVACQQSYRFKENPTGLSELARVCAVAGELSAFVCGPQSDLDEVFDGVETFFGINKGVAIEAVGTALEHVSEIAEPFALEIDTGMEVFELMEKANRALTRLAGNVAECAPAEKLPSPDLPVGHTRIQDASPAAKGITHEVRNRLTTVGRFARRLAKTIDPASREGTYVRVIMSEAERLEQALRRTG